MIMEAGSPRPGRPRPPRGLGDRLDDLRIFAQAAYEAWRGREPDPEEDPYGNGFGDRSLYLETTMDGAGRIRGDLTPECAAAVTAALEALGKLRGPAQLARQARGAQMTSAASATWLA